MSIEKVSVYGQECLALKTPAGASAIICLHGAHLISWKPLPKAEELLYLSDQAKFDSVTAIRGGVPVLFPFFGKNDYCRSHGFARLTKWKCIREFSITDRSVAVFELRHSPKTISMWPYKFSLRLIFTLRNKDIKLEYQVRNLDKEAFSFNGGLHTYFLVDDVSSTAIRGLKGYSYLERNLMRLEQEPQLKISKETDRVYMTGNAVGSLDIISPRASVAIKSTQFGDTVVWNPWREGAKKIDDMADQDYDKMLCVESVTASEEIALGAEASWCGQQHLLCRD